MSEPMARILLVEDDAENRDALGRWLRRRGFDVLSAPNGRTGVEMARSQRPDLILMDMEMPELSGWEATRQIRTEPDGAAAAIPVIGLPPEAHRAPHAPGPHRCDPVRRAAGVTRFN
jgi:two-component system, cell cycle response regulator DivK